MAGNIEAVNIDDVRANFDKYLQMVTEGREVMMFQGNRLVARLVPRGWNAPDIIKSLTGILKSGTDTPMTDSLLGTVKGDYALEQAKDEYFKEKYSLAD